MGWARANRAPGKASQVPRRRRLAGEHAVGSFFHFSHLRAWHIPAHSGARFSPAVLGGEELRARTARALYFSWRAARWRSPARNVFSENRIGERKTAKKNFAEGILPRRSAARRRAQTRNHPFTLRARRTWGKVFCRAGKGPDVNVFVISLQVLWFVLAGASALFTLFLFAFADSPELGKVASRMFYPIVVIGLVAFGIGTWLIRVHSGWWQFPLAYLLALAPPVILLACYKFMLP
jgi:hypothetical protein